MVGEISENKLIRAAVIGVGSLGQHHARVYTQLPGVELVGVADVNEHQAKAVAHKCKCAYTTAYQELVDKVDVVSVVVPTAHHFEVAKTFLEKKVHVLLEKPMTTTVAQADELIALAQANHCCLQIGHIERFNEAIQELKKIIRDPRFIEVHRLGPFSKRNNDIGVVLDLMIHDLDIIMDLVGAGVKQVEAVGVKILTAHEDIANARLTLANGCVANLSASRASVETKRKIRIFSPDSYISIDYQKQELVIFKLKKDRPQDEGNLLNLIDREKVTFGKKEPLMIELSAFIHAVRSGEPPQVTAEHGREALAVALEITRQIREQNYTAQ